MKQYLGILGIARIMIGQGKIAVKTCAFLIPRCEHYALFIRQHKVVQYALKEKNPGQLCGLNMVGSYVSHIHMEMSPNWD